MSLVRLVPAGIHALGDYAAGIVLLLAGIICDGPGAAKATGIVLGIVLIVVSLFTRYPLGAIRVIPFRVHSAGDYLGGILSIIAPFALGFWDDNKGVSTLYIVVGAVVILLSLVTDYNWGPDRDYGAAADARSHRAAGAH
jgi:hypothetical protein